MATFVGIGMGPIQTGIFVAGAAGKCERIVIAEVDEGLRRAVHAAGAITVNIAYPDRVVEERYAPVEVYNPNDPEEAELLIQAAAEATEIATALPSVKFYRYAVGWLREGFDRNPGLNRYIYTAENDNRAAEELAEAFGVLPASVHCLNTVIGKMSGVIPAAECRERGFAPLAPGADRGHLVEAFNTIYISKAPGVETRRVANLFVKDDLLPFEEAKLYGHNAIHFWLGIHGMGLGRKVMSELAGETELLRKARQAFVDESGRALCRKYEGVDALFTPDGFAGYADDLLVRMTNPFLADAIDRVIRDLPRKLSWNDRVIGAMRMVLEQGVEPELLAEGAAMAARAAYGDDPAGVRKQLAELWPQPWLGEHEAVWQRIAARF